jgi:hypothetical protein
MEGKWLALSDTSGAHFDVVKNDPPDGDYPSHRLHELPEEQK